MTQPGEVNLIAMRTAAGRIEPGLAGDEVALATEWGFLPYELTRPYRLHLVVERLDRIELAAAGHIKAILAAIAASGLLLAAWAFVTPAAASWDYSMPVDVGLGSVLFFVAATFCHRVAKPLVFDKTSGRFGRGRLSAGAVGPQHGSGGELLDRIHAIQLLGTGISNIRGRIYATSDVVYHLNLVFEDGSRMNVLRSGNAQRTLHIAMTLAAFLHRPIWDTRYPAGAAETAPV
jgi:hypothetical protein